MPPTITISIGAYSQSTDEAVHKTVNKTADTTVNKNTDKAINSQLSLYRFGQPATTTYPSALKSINHWWQTHLTTEPPHLTNGSGLCRDCTISAAHLSELLTYAYTARPVLDAMLDWTAQH